MMDQQDSFEGNDINISYHLSGLSRQATLGIYEADLLKPQLLYHLVGCFSMQLVQRVVCCRMLLSCNPQDKAQTPNTSLEHWVECKMAVCSD